MDESIIVFVVLFSSSRTLCDDLLPLPQSLLKIRRRFVSSSIAVEGEEEEEMIGGGVEISDKTTAESINKDQHLFLSNDQFHHTSRRNISIDITHCCFNT